MTIKKRKKKMFYIQMIALGVGTFRFIEHNLSVPPKYDTTGVKFSKTAEALEVMPRKRRSIPKTFKRPRTRKVRFSHRKLYPKRYRLVA